MRIGPLSSVDDYKEVERHANVVGIFPDDAVIRLVGAELTDSVRPELEA